MKRKKSVTSGSGCSMLNLNEDSKIFFTGRQNIVAVPTNITGNNFVGCLGDIYINEQKYGVHNFKYQHNETNSIPQSCYGCSRPKISSNEEATVPSFQFDGLGSYVIHKPLKASRFRLSLIIEMTTLDSDATLFFGGNKTRDFIHVKLVGGKISYEVLFGGSTPITRTTQMMYNDNKVHTLYLYLQGPNVLLGVNKDSNDNYVEELRDKSNFKSLDIKGMPQYFGRLPPDFQPQDYKNIQETNPFFGCMKIDDQYVLYESDKQQLHGIEKKQCKADGAYTVGIKHDKGFVQLEGGTFGLVGDNDVSFTFRSLEDNALLIHAKDKSPPENYYSASLHNGKIVVKVKSEEDGSQEITSKNSYFNTNQNPHCVSIVKEGEKIKLLVDDVEEGSIEFKSDVKIVDGILNIGKPPVDLVDQVKSDKNIRGCISNVIINKRLLDFSTSSQRNNVMIGRCWLDKTKDSSTPVSPSTDPQGDAPYVPRSCAVHGDYATESDAKSVANTNTFYADVINKKIKRKHLSKRFHFSFDFRTYYLDGLFGYLTNKDNSFYLGVQLRDGKLEASYIYEGLHKTLSFNQRLNDGEWHSVHVYKKGKTINLNYDKKHTKSAAISAKLDIRLPVHLGGPSPRNNFTKGSQKVHLLPHSVRGCIRAVKVGSFMVDIAQTKAYQDAGKCFKDVEPGAYFNGNAYGMIKEQWTFPETMTINVAFRTTSSNGIILSSDGPKNMGITLELYNGQLQFSVHNSEDKYIVKSTETDYFFCDGKWHTVIVKMSEKLLRMSHDGGDSYFTSALKPFGDTEPMGPLFVGGYRDGFKQSASLSGHRFEGCIRNLKLDGKLVDWYNLIESDNMGKSACPVS